MRLSHSCTGWEDLKWFYQKDHFPGECLILTACALPDPFRFGMCRRCPLKYAANFKGWSRSGQEEYSGSTALSFCSLYYCTWVKLWSGQMYCVLQRFCLRPHNRPAIGSLVAHNNTSLPQNHSLSWQSMEGKPNLVPIISINRFGHWWWLINRISDWCNTSVQLGICLSFLIK